MYLQCYKYIFFLRNYNYIYPALIPQALKFSLSPKNTLTIDFLFPFNLITPQRSTKLLNFLRTIVSLEFVYMKSSIEKSTQVQVKTKGELIQQQNYKRYSNSTLLPKYLALQQLNMSLVHPPSSNFRLLNKAVTLHMSKLVQFNRNSKRGNRATVRKRGKNWNVPRSHPRRPQNCSAQPFLILSPCSVKQGRTQ